METVFLTVLAAIGLLLALLLGIGVLRALKVALIGFLLNFSYVLQR